MEKLYLIMVANAHYYVLCESDVIDNWLELVDPDGDSVTVVEISLSDLDEINHIHFC